MSATAEELNLRVRVADPRPAYCSGCYQGGQETVRFVDFQAAHDSGQLIYTHPDTGYIVERVPGDDLHLCEACVRSAAEALKLNPELHIRQVREIRQLELAVEHWKDYAKTLEATLNMRPEGVRNGRK